MSPALTVALVRVAAVPDFFDVLMVQGKYQLKPMLPFTPGSEFAGVVTDVADDVRGLVVGDRVFGGGALGCFAESVVVPTEMVRVPA